MRIVVITDRMPDGTLKRLEHGPFKTYIEAEEYLDQLRRGGGLWGTPTIEDRTPAPNPDDFPRPLGATPLRRGTMVELELDARHTYCSICRRDHHPRWHQPEWRQAAWEALDAAREAGDVQRANLIRAAIRNQPAVIRR